MIATIPFLPPALVALYIIGAAGLCSALLIPHRVLRHTAATLMLFFLIFQPLVMLSHPAPIAFHDITRYWNGWGGDDGTSPEQGGVTETNVYSAFLLENQAIFIWLLTPGDDYPRAFFLPWDLQLAQELQEAMRQGEENETGVILQLPREPSLDNRPRFYAPPPPAWPPKESVTPPSPPMREFSL